MGGEQKVRDTRDIGLRADRAMDGLGQNTICDLALTLFPTDHVFRGEPNYAQRVIVWAQQFGLSEKRSPHFFFRLCISFTGRAKSSIDSKPTSRSPSPGLRAKRSRLLQNDGIVSSNAFDLIMCEKGTYIINSRARS